MERRRTSLGWKCTLSPQELACASQQPILSKHLENFQGLVPASFEVKILENSDLMLTLMGLLEADGFPTVDNPPKTSGVSQKA